MKFKRFRFYGRILATLPLSLIPNHFGENGFLEPFIGGKRGPKIPPDSSCHKLCFWVMKLNQGRSQPFFCLSPARDVKRIEYLMQILLEFNLEQVIPVLPLTINSLILCTVKSQSWSLFLVGDFEL